MAKRERSQTAIFTGFDEPTSNWFRMPNNWTDITAEIDSLAELKIVEYILRHTWGYQEFGIKKHITIDEFVNGRRRQDATRMDNGTGLSERAVYHGLGKAVARGLIEENVDDSDRGRVKKSYSLHMRAHDDARSEAPNLQMLQSGVQSLHPSLQMLQSGVQSLQARGANFAPRTEKETLERSTTSNLRKASRREEAEKRPGDAAIPGASGSGGRPAPAEGGAPPAPSGRARAIRPRRAPRQDEAYRLIQAYVADFARELNDRAPLKTSTTRAYNLYRRSGLDQGAFVAQLYAARAVVKERTGSIRSRGGSDAAGFPVKNKSPYFFAVLEDLLDLRPEAGGPAGASGAPPAGDEAGPGRGPGRGGGRT